ncbi:MAG: hypothetical protein KAJ19_22120 [Gammaproteobacteria bacterium]|nr:hypothetical protein [Gammaproteobacteria bacterium]
MVNQRQFVVDVKIDECQVCGRTCVIKTFTTPPGFLMDQWMEGDSIEMCQKCHEEHDESTLGW